MDILAAERQELASIPFITSFQADLWGSENYQARSAKLTPLYAERYVGPREAREQGEHCFWEFTFVFAGRGILWGSQAYTLKPGTACLIPPFVPHREEVARKLDTLWVGLHGDTLADLPNGSIQVLQSESLLAPCEQLWLASQRLTALAGPELDGWTQVLLSRFLRLRLDASSQDSDRLNRLIAYIQENMAREITVAEMADVCEYSEGYFYRWFRQHTGETPNEHMTRLRVKNAAHMIRHSTLSLNHIAGHVGYRDPLYFSRVFKQVMGCSPSSLRRPDK